MMDYDGLKFWFDVAQFVLTGAIAVFVWLSNRQRATKSAISRVEEQAQKNIEKMDNRLDEHNDRLLSVERELTHLPNTKDIHEVHYRIDQVGQGVSGLEGEMKQINHTLHLIQQYLMENGK